MDLASSVKTKSTTCASWGTRTRATSAGCARSPPGGFCAGSMRSRSKTLPVRPPVEPTLHEHVRRPAKRRVRIRILVVTVEDLNLLPGHELRRHRHHLLRRDILLDLRVEPAAGQELTLGAAPRARQTARRGAPAPPPAVARARPRGPHHPRGRRSPRPPGSGNPCRRSYRSRPRRRRRRNRWRSPPGCTKTGSAIHQSPPLSLSHNSARAGWSCCSGRMPTCLGSPCHPL